jgi:hypothetical protein
MHITRAALVVWEDTVLQDGAALCAVVHGAACNRARRQSWGYNDSADTVQCLLANCLAALGACEQRTCGERDQIQRGR